MRSQLTEISARQWDHIAQEDLTAKEAVGFLRSGMELRTFSGNLRSLYTGQDLEKRLVEQLSRYAAESDGDVKPDNIRRKVRNWMNDKNIPADREEVFRIAFALELDEKAADQLLLRTLEQGIHYRNAREMIYAFSLKNHQSYAAACACAKIFEERKESEGRQQEPVTRILKMEFDHLAPGEDIIGFMMERSGEFGRHHNTAYRYFMKMLTVLEGGEDGDGDEKKYSMEYISENYLRMNMPEDRRTSGYSDIQKMIKKYWPGIRSIKAMRNRTEDVSRKVLLLLYIVTGGVLNGEYDELDEEYIETVEWLETHCERINDMLIECGMSIIDPRNPFDWLILYCLKPGQDDFMSERMEQIVQELFSI